MYLCTGMCTCSTECKHTQEPDLASGHVELDIKMLVSHPGHNISCLTSESSLQPLNVSFLRLIPSSFTNKEAQREEMTCLRSQWERGWPALQPGSEWCWLTPARTFTSFFLVNFLLYFICFACACVMQKNVEDTLWQSVISFCHGVPGKCLLSTELSWRPHLFSK